MKVKREKKQEFTSISIPLPLFKKVEKHIQNTGFQSVSSYMSFLLRIILSEKNLDDKKFYEAKLIRKKLKQLGYI
ncbi:MAG: CopG family transcriptional regulator [Candidatus Marsarchaeota archaeon]|nr:CopG family transcriptional regulator [Candidatus Marsarchaeota archaeon]MCL5094802.1 CopG family transcriptional regulator [Candidatus Marsarchaeota archaeon]